MAGLQAVTSDMRGWRLIIMAVGIAVSGGVFFGLLFPVAKRSMTTGLDQLPIERQREVGRAARTGPPPTDPELVMQVWNAVRSLHRACERLQYRPGHARPGLG